MCFYEQYRAMTSDIIEVLAVAGYAPTNVKRTV